MFIYILKGQTKHTKEEHKGTPQGSPIPVSKLAQVPVARQPPFGGGFLLPRPRMLEDEQFGAPGERPQPARWQSRAPSLICSQITLGLWAVSASAHRGYLPCLCSLSGLGRSQRGQGMNGKGRGDIEGA